MNAERYAQLTPEQREAKADYQRNWWTTKGNQALREKKRAFKAELVAEKGGQCELCGSINT